MKQVLLQHRLQNYVARGVGGRRKRGKNALSAHFRGLFAAIGVSNDF